MLNERLETIIHLSLFLIGISFKYFQYNLLQFKIFNSRYNQLQFQYYEIINIPQTLENTWNIKNTYIRKSLFLSKRQHAPKFRASHSTDMSQRHDRRSFSKEHDENNVFPMYIFHSLSFFVVLDSIQRACAFLHISWNHQASILLRGEI